MGFLDHLKRQAEATQAAEQPNLQALERNARLADAACRTTAAYWQEMVKHLNVLKPPARGRYAFDLRHVAEDLHLADFRTDARLRSLNQGEHYDHVVLNARLRTTQRLAIEKDFPPEIERLEARLKQAGIAAHGAVQRHPTTGRVVGMRYEFAPEIALSLRLVPLHDTGKVEFTLTNIDGLQTTRVEFPAFAVRPPLLDELAKWLLGEPNDFLHHGQNLRREEP